MSDPTDSFKNHLLTLEKVPSRDMDRVSRLSEETGDSLSSLLVKLGLIPEAELADLYSEFAGLRRVASDDLPLKVVTAEGLSARFLRDQRLAPFILDDSGWHLVMSDPLDEFSVDAVEFAVGSKPTRLVSTRAEIEKTLNRWYPVTPEASLTAGAQKSPEAEVDDIDHLRDLASEAPVIRTVQRLITEAIDRQASDIHLEPMEDSLKVRYRMDGLLSDVESLPSHQKAAIVSRVKIMAHLNIAERRLPQDGRIRMTIHGKETDFRVATSPTLHGESVVLRVLDRRDVALDFQALGFSDDNLAKLHRALKQPHGVILVTGPTGSGKTTTLYAALKVLNAPDKKILTAEDPIEYTLDRVNQVQVKPQIGHDFANALRAFLRQDPDIMMVGEIRDQETARVAVQAALTGHLLLSTLHTNSASGAVARLLDMGIEEYLLASTLTLVLGQRLVRRLCEHCREPFSPSPGTIEQLRRNGMEIPADAKLFRPVGCERCKGTGYAGRCCVAESLEVTDPIQKLILARADASTIEREAIRQGMRTMNQDGFQKALAGQTTVEEVLRVTQNL